MAFGVPREEREGGRGQGLRKSWKRCVSRERGAGEDACVFVGWEGGRSEHCFGKRWEGRILRMVFLSLPERMAVSLKAKYLAVWLLSVHLESAKIWRKVATVSPM